MTRHARNLYLILLAAVLANSLLWLDSFERYLNGRYHIDVSQYLPDSAFIPSRVVREAIAPDEYVARNLDQIVPPETRVSVRQPMAEMSAASGVADQPLPTPEVNAQQAVVLKVDLELHQGQAPAEPGQPQEQLAPAVADSDLRVLFAGDSMMQGVAPIVISRLRKDYPKGVFVDVSKPSTGLVAKRYFDWPKKIEEESIKHRIQIIVMFLGPNDPWDIYEGKKRYAFPSESWEEKYRGRVDEVLDFAASNGIRVIWIGLPVMREERIKQGAKIENRIFQGEAEKYKFEYMPTEDFLGSLDAPYTKYIEDPKRGKLAVRLDDGVHFTKLGLRMISSRVDELLRKRESL